MKTIFKIWIAISIVFLVLLILGLIDSYVSLKYEIEPYEMSNKVTEAIADKRHLLKNLIFILRIAAIYLVINIIVLFRWTFGKT